jgi:hypothetical protein
MAREDIVSGVFGLTPEMYQAGQTQRDIAEQQAAQEAANASGGLFAKAYAPQIQQQAQLTARAVGGILGVEDPQLQMVREVSNIRNQFDITTPEGMQGFAQAIAPKYPTLAMQALDKVATLEDMRSKADLRRAQADKALRGPVTSPEQLLTSGKYTPASVAKYQQSGNIADLVLVKGAGGEGGAEGPGPVGKAGAYRDAFGQIYGGGEMKTVRQEFDTNEKLLAMLNKVTEDDVKKAESIIDWTTKEGVVKGAGAKLASDTVTAQTKIAASQLLKQIESLPPGSASNADMVAAMKDFPGYGSQAALAAWINRAKDTIQNNLGRQVEQFGFRQRVQATAPLDVTKQAEKPAKKEQAPKVIKLD